MGLARRTLCPTDYSKVDTQGLRYKFVNFRRLQAVAEAAGAGAQKGVGAEDAEVLNPRP